MDFFLSFVCFVFGNVFKSAKFNRSMQLIKPKPHAGVNSSQYNTCTQTNTQRQIKNFWEMAEGIKLSLLPNIKRQECQIETEKNRKRKRNKNC